MSGGLRGSGTLLGKRLRLDSLSEGDQNELIEAQAAFEGFVPIRLDHPSVKSNSQKSRISSQNKSIKAALKNEQANESQSQHRRATPRSICTDSDNTLLIERIRVGFGSYSVGAGSE